MEFFHLFILIFCNKQVDKGDIILIKNNLIKKSFECCSMFGSRCQKSEHNFLSVKGIFGSVIQLFFKVIFIQKDIKIIFILF
jgi:hypothetical protein